jgi:hypothetical protein
MFFRRRRRREFRNSAWMTPRSITPLFSAPTFQLAQSAMKNLAFGPLRQSRKSPGGRQEAGSPGACRWTVKRNPSRWASWQLTPTPGNVSVCPGADYHQRMSDSYIASPGLLKTAGRTFNCASLLGERLCRAMTPKLLGVQAR